MNRTASPQQRTLLLTAVAAVGATTALTLSGCAVDYLPANNDSGANRSQSASSGAGQSASSGAGQSASSGITSHPQTPEGTGDSDDALDGEHADAGLDSRDDYADAVERTISCPDGVLEITDVSSVLELDSDCTDITVLGSGTVLLANNIETLDVTGVNNLVFVEELTTLTALGHGNVVTWESGSPTVSDKGVNNRLNPAR